MDPVSIVSAAGSAFSGVADIIGSIGQVSRQKKIIAAQEQSQKNLMDYQNDIQRQNIADDRAYNEDWTQRYFDQYESLSARRADAEAAGFNPEAILGTSSGAGSAASAGNVGGVTVPSSPEIENKSSAQGIISGLGQMMQSLQAINELKHLNSMQTLERESAALDLDAKMEDIRRLRYSNSLLGNTVDRIGKDNDYIDWSRDRDKSAWDLNARDQHLRFQAMYDDYKRNKTRWTWEQEDRPNAVESQKLQNSLLKGKINNENWLYQYRKVTGKNPPSNMTFLEFASQILGLGLIGNGDEDFSNHLNSMSSGFKKFARRYLGRDSVLPDKISLFGK